MNCKKCQELISAFLDNELDTTVSSDVQTHLAICGECAKICEDFSMMLDFCEEDVAANSLPPNPNALWCRINNIIETEVKPEIERENSEKEIISSGNRFSRMWNSNWQFSLSQIAVSVLGIALISSLLTIVGIKNYSQPNDNLTAKTTVSETIFEKVLGKFGFVETAQQKREKRLKERQQAIDYWRSRVENKRAEWDSHLRNAFDRNLSEINRAVFEYNRNLQNNPEDELSGEMLDSAMDEKMELLREFAEL